MNRTPVFLMLDSIARERMPEGTDLAPRILAALSKKNAHPRLPRARFALAVIALLLVGCAFFSAIGVIKLRDWLGYLPGIGLVNPGTVRVLAEPAQATRNGIQADVTEFVADGNRTSVVFSVQGIPGSDLPADLFTQECESMPQLRLPDGALLDAQWTSRRSWSAGYEAHSTFPALPLETRDVILIAPCLGEAAALEIPIRLKEATVDLGVVPVQNSAKPDAEDAGTVEEAVPSPQGIAVSIDRFAQLEDGYVLFGRYQYGQEKYSDVYAYPGYVQLTDNEGREIMLAETDEQTERGSGWNGWALRTAGIKRPGPLTLTITYVEVEEPIGVTMQIEVPASLSPDQIWRPEMDVPAGGYLLRLRTVQYVESEGLQNLEMEFAGPPEVLCIIVMDRTAGGGAAGSTCWRGSDGRFTVIMKYNRLPAGPLTMRIDSLTANLPGPWKVEWTPPALTETADAAPAGACITKDSWRYALDQHPAIPEGLDGTLLGFDRSSRIWTIRLDGTGRREIETGREATSGVFGDLNAGASKVVYTGSDGLYIHDLNLGESIRVPHTLAEDILPQWSPDGTRIAFLRNTGSMDIFVISADGTGLRMAAPGPGAGILVDWMADGGHLLSRADTQEGGAAKRIDVETGESTDILHWKDFGEVWPAAPDQSRYLYSENLLGTWHGLYLTGPEGGDPRLLMNGDLLLVAAAWDPAGEWLALSLMDLSQTNPLPVLTLLQPSNCQIIPLPEMEGWFSSWSP